MNQPPGADIVIVAAGRSRRMGGLDKLGHPMMGRPLLGWTAAAMSMASCLRRLVLVVAPEQVEDISRADWLPAERTVVAGGPSRSESVRAGLAATDAELVLVHDGARPLATPALADAVALATSDHGAAVPVVELVDALKRVETGRVVEGVERHGLVRAQTPQGVRRELLVEAFAAATGEAFSDEAALLQARGIPVASLPGEPLNLKVTHAEDLEIVRAVLQARSGATALRRGLGQDSHPFGPGDALRLGGMTIEDAPRLYGHSDGDVVLHALASALLSAAGLGDLGRHFPANDPTSRDADSSELLRAVLERVARAGWRPVAAQLSVLGARPRLGAVRLERMREAIAELLGLPVDSIALSASSGNLSGAEGAGRAISASAGVDLASR